MLPVVVAVEDLRQVVNANSRTTCQELAEMFRVSPKTIRLRLHQLGKTWKLPVKTGSGHSSVRFKILRIEARNSREILGFAALPPKPGLTSSSAGESNISCIG
ncbi:unnamed protein product [Acanthoscelides obtectus]|uniref:Helix-turn-helix type 11 domain-containing protein n=1 Tax=Acanthoscelides obtectus TaxID=200917 RepID=A0A9P0KJW8_ACAOB|nr:unnamed protein product [Acanthoscelides obtectus]CAK1650128.1 hypothetical protein AOBTE_LOCUS16616 [Acanthoscelides obtectus]